MKLLLDNLPPSLASQRDTLRRCLEAMDAALPIQQVILFGSHARGEARPDSDIDLCLVAEGATPPGHSQAQLGNEVVSTAWERAGKGE